MWSAVDRAAASAAVVHLSTQLPRHVAELPPSLVPPNTQIDADTHGCSTTMSRCVGLICLRCWMDICVGPLRAAVMCDDESRISMRCQGAHAQNETSNHMSHGCACQKCVFCANKATHVAILCFGSTRAVSRCTSGTIVIRFL